MSKFIDKLSNMVVLGSLLCDPSILSKTEEYTISFTDFAENRMHQICFGSINNLYAQGLNKIDITDVYAYLEKVKPEHAVFFKKENGTEFLSKCISLSSNGEKFPYYYDNMKKMTLLRTFDGNGISVNDIYNPDTLDLEEKTRQQNWLDNTSIEDIILIIDDKITKLKDDFKFEGTAPASLMGDGVDDFLERVKETPAVGAPLPFGLWNTVTAGARLKKVYLVSAATGKGKSREMLSSMLYLSCGEYYDVHQDKWIKLGWQEPSFFISTELDEDELMAMSLAFISGVNEDKINGKEMITTEEIARVKKAAEILKTTPCYRQIVPDFSVEDIERHIKVNIEKRGVKYCAFDYIHSSIKILAEVAQQTKGVKLREDNVLFMLSVRLKDLANKYGVFIMSGTQVNAAADGDDGAHAGMLRGARAIADKMDYAEIMRGLNDKDREAYTRIKAHLSEDLREFEPNLIKEVFKNRGNKYSNGKLWCHADLGTCQILPLFYTDETYELINMPLLDIEIIEE